MVSTWRAWQQSGAAVLWVVTELQVKHPPPLLPVVTIVAVTVHSLTSLLFSVHFSYLSP